jgi:hypothetical protein
MSKSTVKYTAKGDLKIKLSWKQFEDFLTFLDWLPDYQRNSQMTPAFRVWNLVTQRIKDRYLIAFYAEGKEQSITLKMEEAVILKEMYHRAPDDIRGLLVGVMLELDQKVISYA